MKKILMFYIIVVALGLLNTPAISNDNLNYQVKLPAIDFIGIPLEGNLKRFEQKLINKGFIKIYDKFTNETTYFGPFMSEAAIVSLKGNSFGDIYELTLLLGARNDLDVSYQYTKICRKYKSSNLYFVSKGCMPGGLLSRINDASTNGGINFSDSAYIHQLYTDEQKKTIKENIFKYFDSNSYFCVMKDLFAGFTDQIIDYYIFSKSLERGIQLNFDRTIGRDNFYSIQMIYVNTSNLPKANDF